MDALILQQSMLENKAIQHTIQRHASEQNNNKTN